MVDVSYLNVVEPDYTPRLSMKAILEMREAKAKQKASRLAAGKTAEPGSKWGGLNLLSVKRLKPDLKKEEIEEESE